MCGGWLWGLTKSSKHRVCTSELIKSFDQIQHRGPEHSRFDKISKTCYSGFKRLSINDIHATGYQPFYHPTKNIVLMCNGEIYNYPKLALLVPGKLMSTSDCEILLWLYDMYGMEEMLQMLDGVFAMIIYDGEKEQIFAARDPYGVRPLFIGYNDTPDKGYIALCSEMKGIHDIWTDDDVNEIKQFRPGNYCTYDLNSGSMEYVQYHNYDYRPEQSLEFMTDFKQVENQVCAQIRETLLCSVKKRFTLTDRPVGCLLSGGLDSSLISAIVSEYFDDPKQLHTFSIGMEGGTDTEFAQKVADFIGSTHHSIILTKEDFCNTIDEVVRITESWDTTTIRASIGNYLVSKWISENTDIKVIFNGDGADELFGGYIYFRNAPTPTAFRDECSRLLREIHLYDGLRSDRSISGCGLEARTPFLDLELVQCAMSIPAKWTDCANKKIEKYFLRRAFDPEMTQGKQYLPKDVLWRKKEAFSDGVSNTEETTQSILQNHIASRYGSTFSSDFFDGPLAMEKSYYRQLFEDHYPGRSTVIPGEWLPRWCGNISDPSARELEHYI